MESWIEKIGNNRLYVQLDQRFGCDRFTQVRIDKTYSDSIKVDNGTPQGSIISPILYSFMINDVYTDNDNDIGRSLFADDGA